MTTYNPAQKKTIGMTTEISLLSAFLIGVAGSVHCIGMCGGIVTALGFSAPKGANQSPYYIAYHSGRIISYSVAGALTGGLGQLFSHQLQAGLNILQIISGVFLLLLAFYIGNWWRGLMVIESVGQKIWRHIAPFSKKLLPLKHPAYALPYGLIWGWLPCGLVYSTLSWSLASGSAFSGALVMLAFGLGTLPALVALTKSGLFIQNVLKSPHIKQVIALILMFFALYTLSGPLQNIV